MELDGILQESRSITQFFKPIKKQVIREKQKRKAEEQHRIRKNSMQLSIFSWLTKPRPKQEGKINQLSKNIILTIFGYLRISQIVNISQTCFFLNQCAKTIWNDSEFLGQLETDQLSSKQLQLILTKSGKLQHIKQLRNIYRGKNLKLRRQKIKLKLQKSNQNCLSPITGNLLEVFQVSPKTLKSSTFLMDNHLQEVVNSSFRSLTQIRLISCACLRKFEIISKCIQLQRLQITNNCFLSSDHIRIISKCCPNIKYLDVSGCEYLDQNIFKHLSKLNNLQIFKLSHYNQPFSSLQNLSTNKFLKEISIQNSCIMDSQAIQLVNMVQNLQYFNISGCKLLTDSFLFWITTTQHKMLKILLDRTEFSQQSIRRYLNFVHNK